jgi:hypothetical protein
MDLTEIWIDGANWIQLFKNILHHVVRDHSEDQYVDRKIILKWILEKYGGEV